MPLHQQRFDGFPVLAGAQFIISQTMLDVEGCIEIGVRAETTNHTAKRLLVGSVSSIWIVAHAALLRRIGALDPDRGDTSLGSIPGDLLGDVCQVGSIQIGIHGTRFVLHGGNRQVLISELRALVLSKALVDRAVDRLPHMAGETLPALAARRRELLDPFFLQAFL